MKRHRYVLFAVLLLPVLLSISALASSVLDFGIQAPTPGVISYAGGAKPLIGKNIQVDNITGLLTPLNSGVTIQIIGGLLNFTTGNYADGSTSTWDFNGGSTATITVTGCADVDKDGGKCDSKDISGTLATGTFDTGESIVVQAFPGSKFKIVGGTFIDIKNPLLAAYFGLKGGSGLFYDGGLNLSFSASGLPPHAFKSTVAFSGDMADTPISEPGSLAMLGAGLLGLGFLAEKYLSKRTTLRGKGAQFRV